jgi:hypothetical protein
VATLGCPLWPVNANPRIGDASSPRYREFTFLLDAEKLASSPPTTDRLVVEFRQVIGDINW